ncbi:MAG: InlB B-repeat-containing protein, partial [Chitinispirillales bacterium]|nr:InlB B-repeat-containing protein [Chitinispirillales bacterium]
MQNKSRFLRVAATIAALCVAGNAADYVPNVMHNTNGTKVCDYPAIVEVYAVGGGGGGEGGHRRYCMLDEYKGTGSSGGGGATVYAKFRASQGSSFVINVGAGGRGGAYRYTKCGEDWGNGHDGENGHSTTITFDGTQIIAGGGGGGGVLVSGETMTGGGPGGVPSIINYTNIIASNGEGGGRGSDGKKSGDLGANCWGGNAGYLSGITGECYHTSFGGGLGAVKGGRLSGLGGGGNAEYYYYGDGSKGADGSPGEVCAYVTYLWTVIFNSTGGLPTPSSISEILNGRRIIEPSKPAKDYHVFNGWFKNPDCTDKWYFENPVTQSMTLYAGWLDTRYGDTLGVP